MLSYRCVAEVAVHATLLHKDVVNLAFASTKGLRSNTRAQGYEDVENEELSARRFFSHRDYFGTTIWLCCLPLFRAYEFIKLSTFRFWGEVSKCMGQLLFCRDNVSLSPQSG